MAKNTGVDPIFDLAGIAKPTEWASWTQAQRHAFLQERGIYPARGSKYQGEFDLDRYFQFLGVVQPADWTRLSTAERQEWIASLAQNEKDLVVEQSLTSATVSPLPVPTSSLTTGGISPVLLVSGVVGGVVLLALFARVSTAEALRRARLVAYVGVPLGIMLLIWLAPSTELFAKFGTASLLLIAANLYLKPLCLLFPKSVLRQLMAYRRQLGVAAVWLAVGHSLSFMQQKSLWSLDRYLGFDNHYIYGGLAFIGMLILGLTSNPWATTTLKRWWKRVQRLAYPTFFLVLVHAALASGEFGLELTLLVGFLLLRSAAALRSR